MVPRVHPGPQPKWHLDRFSLFARLTSVSDRLTDHATRSVTIGRIYTVSQNVPPLTCYNLYIHGSIATIFGKNVAEKVAIKMYFIFPHHLTIASALPEEWRHRKPRNCVFSLKCCMFFLPKTGNTVKNIIWSELNNPSLSKRSTGCTKQDLGREHRILLSVTHMLCVSQVCHGVSRCVKDGSCSSSNLE